MLRILFLCVFLMGCTVTAATPMQFLLTTPYGPVKGTQRVEYGWVDNLTFEFKSPEPGIYLIEAWQNPHRRPNVLRGEYLFVAEPAFERTLTFTEEVYRIDVIRIAEGKATRSVLLIEGNQGCN